MFLQGYAVVICCLFTPSFIAQMRHLQCIVYVSSARSKFSDDELEALLMEARELNRGNSITGILLYNDGNFIQCLEGPAEAVAETYKRIKTSRRHFGVLELMNERIESLSFREWEMGLAQPTKSELLKLTTSKWTSQEKRDVDTPQSPPGLELLKAFWHASNPLQGGRWGS